MEIGIDLYGGSSQSRQGLQFDLGCVLMRLFQTFPEIVLEEEYFKKHLAIVESVFAERGAAEALKVAVRDAEELGPRFRFIIKSPGGSPMYGGFTRYIISFRFDHSVDVTLRAKAEDFLNSFSIEKFSNN